MNYAEKRIADRQNYTTLLSNTLWEFEFIKFNDDIFTGKQFVQNSRAFHYEGKEKHEVKRLSVYENRETIFGLEWSYDFCAICNRVVQRKAILFDLLENDARIRIFEENQ